MSVLVEALALVVRKSELEARYPGGPEAFLEDAGALVQPPRFVCADEHLVSLSFYDPGHMEPCRALLAEHGLDQVAEGVRTAACLDQDLGPGTACPWIAWARPEGVTFAWLAGTDPGEMAADEDWSAERSRGLVRRESVEQPGRLLRLGEEQGLETWLDLRTGRQLVGLEPSAEGPVTAFLGDAGLEPRPARESEEAEDSGEAQRRLAHLRRRIVEVLEAEDLLFIARDPLWVDVPVTAGRVRLTVRLGPSENGGLLRLYVTTEMRVPEEYRAAACELLTLANYGLPAGNFEMDLRDGEVVFKGSIYLGDDGEFTDAQVGSAIRGGIFLYDRYYPALMRVIYGGVSPAEAIQEVEG